MTKFLKNKHGEGYIDVIIGIFISLIIIAVTVGLFQTMYKYQKISDIATATAEYASIQGKISNNNEVTEKIEKLIEANGFNVDEVKVSFDGTSLMSENTGSETSTYDRVQYGDTICVNVSLDTSIGFMNSDGFIKIPISVSKVTTSQKFWK